MWWRMFATMVAASAVPGGAIAAPPPEPMAIFTPSTFTAPAFASPSIATFDTSKAFRILGDLGLRVDATTMLGNPLDANSAPLRHRIASSMMEYYPIHGSGLRISAGMRFFSVFRFANDAERTTHELLYTPRMYGIGGVRAGFRRYTPAATIGYTKLLGKSALLGLEAGSLLGHATATMPRSMTRFGNRTESAGGMNPIVNMVFGFRF